MARRLPSQPPVMPGFSHVHILGSGGFADVFLYEQNMPRRQVAVKVMLSEIVNDQIREMFQAEANLMAQLSSHPSILTVYQAGVSSDGRPFLVMELCSPGLSDRYRRERIPVADILQIAVKIGSAVETAHREGVLHRDIKPSNILLTAYGHPVLSDFGIASTLNESSHREAVGMSIPWSAPEVLMDETSGTVASEVWSLAATIYSLLAGRSPFEIPGESNKSTDLITRINRAKPEPIGRSDVPESLENLLRKAMSRKAEQRPANVMEFVRGLQAIESELGVPQTPMEIAVDEWALAKFDGTALYEAVAVLFIAQVYGLDLSLTQQGVVALTALLASVGAAGIPHAGTVMMVVVLSAVGLPTTAVGLILAVDRVLDMCRTAVNVYSDSVAAAVVAHFEQPEAAEPS